jgi:glycerol-3-phosphate dehydrogenase
MVSAWTGIRPLVVETEEDKKAIQEKEYLEDSTFFRRSKRTIKRGVIKLGTFIHGKPKGSTANLSRNHVIEISNSGLVSLMGGKWTSFRKMGEETVDKILETSIG